MAATAMPTKKKDKPGDLGTLTVRGKLNVYYCLFVVFLKLKDLIFK